MFKGILALGFVISFMFPCAVDAHRKHGHYRQYYAPPEVVGSVAFYLTGSTIRRGMRAPERYRFKNKREVSNRGYKRGRYPRPCHVLNFSGGRTVVACANEAFRFNKRYACYQARFQPDAYYPGTDVIKYICYREN